MMASPTTDRPASNRLGGRGGSTCHTACDEAVPFLLRRVPPGSPMGLAWTAADLPIDGLPSLEALFMTTWSDYDPEQGWSLDELAYSTGGSGAFRGVISW